MLAAVEEQPGSLPAVMSDSRYMHGEGVGQESGVSRTYGVVDVKIRADLAVEPQIIENHRSKLCFNQV